MVMRSLKGLALLLSFTAFGLQSAYSQIALISDLDDTIKRTNVADTSEAIYNALFTQDIFAGTDALLSGMQSYGEFYILSASPNLLRFNIDKLIKIHRLAPREVFTREVSELGKKIEYKLETIKSVDQMGYEGLILMGDDVEADPIVYTRYEMENPGRVLSIYIHKISGADLPRGVKSYSTPYEVALQEVLANRMQEEQAYQIGLDLLEADLAELFPDFKFCPEAEDQLNLPALDSLDDLSLRIARRIVAFCRDKRD